MSAETREWLNTQTLQGFADKRGSAWHRDDSLAKDGKTNHYPGAIPQEDVFKRLLSWEPVRVGEWVGSYTDEKGEKVTVTAPDHIAMARPRGALGKDDPGEVFAYFKSDYATHSYKEWGVQALGIITDGGLKISSAGLLKGGAVFWVQAELEDNYDASGVAFRPFITAASSANGYLATTYMTGAQVIVCDNTLSAAMRDPKANRVAVRHSAKSLERLGDVRDALGLVQTVGEEFTKQVNALLDVKFTGPQWERFMDELAGLVDSDGKKKDMLPMHAGMGNQKRAAHDLLAKDDMVAPWVKTGFGAVQLVNTYAHHMTGVADGDRVGRNMMNQITNEWGKTDLLTLKRIERITKKKVAI